MATKVRASARDAQPLLPCCLALPCCIGLHCWLCCRCAEGRWLDAALRELVVGNKRSLTACPIQPRISDTKEAPPSGSAAESMRLAKGADTKEADTKEAPPFASIVLVKDFRLANYALAWLDREKPGTKMLFDLYADLRDPQIGHGDAILLFQLYEELRNAIGRGRETRGVVDEFRQTYRLLAELHQQLCGPTDGIDYILLHELYSNLHPDFRRGRGVREMLGDGRNMLSILLDVKNDDHLQLLPPIVKRELEEIEAVRFTNYDHHLRVQATHSLLRVRAHPPPSHPILRH